MSRRHFVRSLRRRVGAIVEACEGRRLLCADHVASAMLDAGLTVPEGFTSLTQDSSATKHDTGPSYLLSTPSFSSRPSAPLSIYLDFDGEGSSYLPFDLDSDNTTFSATELAAIQEAWRQVTEYFSAFDVNVTTVKPSSSDNFVWDVISNSTGSGVAFGVGSVRAMPHPTSPSCTDSSYEAVHHMSALAHEIGHVMGLNHQGTFTNDGIRDTEYRVDPDVTRQSVMGQDNNAITAKWQKGQASGYPTVPNTNFQDDVEILAATVAMFGAPGSDGFKTDDYSGSLASPTALSVSSGVATGAGVIERLTDADVFSFTLASTSRTRIEVNPTWPSGVDLRATLYDSSGNVVLGLDDQHSLDQQTTVTLTSGTYRLRVEGSGNIGDIGSYTVSVSPFAADWQTARLQPGRTGSVNYNSTTGAFNLEGVGMNPTVANAADSEFVYQVLQGDGSIVGRVTFDASARSGYLGFAMRTSLDANSPKVQILLSTADIAGIFGFGVRDTTGDALTATASGPSAAAGTSVWLKLQRASGNQLSAYSSADGVTWTQVGTTVSPAAIGSDDVYIGMVASSYSARSPDLDQVGRGTIDNVSITGVTISATTFYGSTAAPAWLYAYPSSGTSLNIAWASVSGASSYLVQWSPDGVNYEDLGVTSVTYYAHDPGYGSARQFYRVRAVSGFIAGQAATFSIANGPATPPSAQAQAVPAAAGQAVIRWEDSYGETGYTIYRSTNGGSTYSLIATLASNTVTYLDTGAVAGANNLYRVYATGAPSSSPATTNSLHLRPLAPSALSFSRTSSTSGTLSWTAPAYATNYTIERSTNGGSSWSTLATGVISTSYSDTSRTDLDAYEYRVTAYDSASAASDGAVLTVISADPSKAIPSPWSLTNVGGTNLETGNAEYDSGTFTLSSTVRNAAGNDTPSTFVYQVLSGDGSITARLTARPTNATSSTGYHAGLMMAADLTTLGAKITLELGLAGVFTYRTSTASSSKTSNYITLTGAPVWYRLTRVGTTVSADYSSDGVTWYSGGSDTVALGTNAYVGIFDTTYGWTTSGIATKAIFDNVTVYDASPLVAPGNPQGNPVSTERQTRRDDVWSQLAIAEL